MKMSIIAKLFLRNPSLRNTKLFSLLIDTNKSALWISQVLHSTAENSDGVLRLHTPLSSKRTFFATKRKKYQCRERDCRTDIERFWTSANTVRHNVWSEYINCWKNKCFKFKLFRNALTFYTKCLYKILFE